LLRPARPRLERRRRGAAQLAECRKERRLQARAGGLEAAAGREETEEVSPEGGLNRGVDEQRRPSPRGPAARTAMITARGSRSRIPSAREPSANIIGTTYVSGSPRA